MPDKALHFCRHPGCSELVDIGYCTAHQAEQDQAYARIRAKDASMYDARWRKVRAAYLRRNPLCEQCNRNGLTVRAELVHHIKEIKQGGSMYDPTNLMALCNSCHEDLHKANRWRRRD